MSIDIHPLAFTALGMCFSALGTISRKLWLHIPAIALTLFGMILSIMKL